MTTSSLVGLETQSSQEPNQQSPNLSILAGATQRLAAYNRLKAWLRMPQAEAEAEAQAFQQAVKRLTSIEQQQVAAAEADALRHGFSFIDFQKIKGYALKAIEEPFADVGFEDDDAFKMAAMLALHNN
jgi:hypothetical protein